MVNAQTEDQGTDISIRGPHGLGDPNDRTLRKVEMNVLIPKKIREKAKEKCANEVKDFHNCCTENGVSLIVKCRKENSIMKECLGYWFKNPQFYSICKEEYLEERSEYRRSGLTKKQKLRLQSS